MSPRKGNANALWPLVVASRIRALFQFEHLEVRLRLRIRARRHAHGISLSPVNTSDVEACAWIEALAEQYGVYKWKTQTPRGRGGWVKEKFQKRNRDMVK